MKVIERIHLAFFGWVTIDGVDYIDCPIHGLSRAYVHGFKELVECLKCYSELRREKENCNIINNA